MQKQDSEKSQSPAEALADETAGSTLPTVVSRSLVLGPGSPVLASLGRSIAKDIVEGADYFSLRDCATRDLLIFEDQEMLRAWYSDILELFGFIGAIHQAETTSEALTILKDQRLEIGIMIQGWNQPNGNVKPDLIDGESEHEWFLRCALKLRPNLKIIVSTGSGNSERVSIRAGAFEFFNKPVDVHALVSSVAAAQRTFL